MSNTWSVLFKHRRVVGTVGVLLAFLVLAVGDVAALGNFLEQGVSLLTGP